MIEVLRKELGWNSFVKKFIRKLKAELGEELSK
jgi:hypothetical protein